MKQVIIITGIAFSGIV